MRLQHCRPGLHGRSHHTAHATFILPQIIFLHAFVLSFPNHGSYIVRCSKKLLHATRFRWNGDRDPELKQDQYDKRDCDTNPDSSKIGGIEINIPYQLPERPQDMTEEPFQMLLS